MPPRVSALDPDTESGIIEAKISNLSQIIPEITDLASNLENCRVKGGWVYAAGKGSLSDPGSELHKRNRLGIFARKGYFSVDTGKYSTAPWLAKILAQDIESLVS